MPLALYPEAERFFTKAPDVREKSLNRSDPDLINTTRSLARLCYKQRQYAEATPRYQRVARALETKPDSSEAEKADVRAMGIRVKQALRAGSATGQPKTARTILLFRDGAGGGG
jgi:tetratricopeptide repeat protein